LASVAEPTFSWAGVQATGVAEDVLDFDVDALTLPAVVSGVVLGGRWLDDEVPAAGAAFPDDPPVL
jgi:hypothetical protein